jgi:hypothetical protein
MSESSGWLFGTLNRPIAHPTEMIVASGGRSSRPGSTSLILSRIKNCFCGLRTSLIRLLSLYSERLGAVCPLQVIWEECVQIQSCMNMSLQYGCSPRLSDYFKGRY